MLKPLTTNYKGREVTLECTHKKTFPPPQMYGSTPEDIDTLWKQGTIDQNQYQHLKVWGEKCGLMVMGPRCLDCPLALKQNPRPGRPNVIETENWLKAKNQMHWDDMKAGKLAPPTQPKEAQMDLGNGNGEPVHAGSHDEAFPVEPEVVAVPEPEPAPEPEPEPEAKEAPASIADMLSGAEEEEGEGSDLDDDIISALADD